jgi:Tfp pilus assembly protein FimT
MPRPVTQSCRDSLHSSRGFTLVGTLATVTILGILIAIGAPQFTESIERARLKHAAEALTSQLDLIRLEAVRRSADLTVTFVTGTSWCLGVDDTGRCDCSVANDCGIRSTSGDALAPKVTLSGTYSSSSALVFDQIRGSATSGSLTLATPSGYDLRVVLSGRGRIRICSPSGNVPGYASC